MKVQADTSLELPQEHNQDQTPLTNQLGSNMNTRKVLYSFILVLKGKAGTMINESSRFQFSEKLFCKHFCFIRGRQQHLMFIE